MKKQIVVALSCVMMVGLLALVGCAPSNNTSDQTAGQEDTSPSGDVSVYSREDGSGTRGAFIELFDIEEKDANGEKVDKTTTSASITNSTSVMMTSVAGDENAIGYLSLGSLNNTVKAVDIDGVKATADNVKNGTYKVSRPFNIATKDDLSDVAQDFIDYIMSVEGQEVVEKNGYISAEDNATAYEQKEGLSGKIVLAGSSSVSPVMEKLKEAYEAINPDVNIEVQTSDSTTGMNMAMEGTCDIGMASRELKDSELSAGITGTVIAQDGIAVIVNNNSSVDALTADQVKDIYVGTAKTWEEVLGL